jgi:hypothetical protein
MSRLSTLFTGKKVVNNLPVMLLASAKQLDEVMPLASFIMLL